MLACSAHVMSWFLCARGEKQQRTGFALSLLFSPKMFVVAALFKLPTFLPMLLIPLWGNYLYFLPAWELPPGSPQLIVICTRDWSEYKLFWSKPKLPRSLVLCFCYDNAWTSNGDLPPWRGTSHRPGTRSRACGRNRSQCRRGLSSGHRVNLRSQKLS